VLANMHMAQVLKAKGYPYQFVYAKEAGHVDRSVRAMTLAPGLEWLWKDYKPVTGRAASRSHASSTWNRKQPRANHFLFLELSFHPTGGRLALLPRKDAYS